MVGSARERGQSWQPCSLATFSRPWSVRVHSPNSASGYDRSYLTHVRSSSWIHLRARLQLDQPTSTLSTRHRSNDLPSVAPLPSLFPIDAQVSITFPHRHFSPSIPLSSALVNRSRILLPFQGYWDTITKDRNLGGKRTRGFTLSLLGKLAFTLEKSCFWLEASQLREIEDFFKIIFFNLGLGFFFSDEVVAR